MAGANGQRFVRKTEKEMSGVGGSCNRWLFKSYAHARKQEVCQTPWSTVLFLTWIFFRNNWTEVATLAVHKFKAYLFYKEISVKLLQRCVMSKEFITSFHLPFSVMLTIFFIFLWEIVISHTFSGLWSSLAPCFVSHSFHSSLIVNRKMSTSPGLLVLILYEVLNTV